MHHVANPAAIIGEMLRGARLGVFISDGNIYAQGSKLARLVKLALSSAGLLKPVNWVRRGWKLWVEREGDGVAYTYSVFDSLPVLAAVCDQVFVVPTSGARDAGRSPLRYARHLLACGFKASLA